MAAVSPTDRLIWSTICTIFMFQATPKMKISLYPESRPPIHEVFCNIIHEEIYIVTCLELCVQPTSHKSTRPLPPGAICLAIGLPANLVAQAWSCSASPRQLLDLSEAEWYSKFSNYNPYITFGLHFISYLLVSTRITLVSHRPKDSRTLGCLDEKINFIFKVVTHPSKCASYCA
jgi:hypothetical protein